MTQPTPAFWSAGQGGVCGAHQAAGGTAGGRLSLLHGHEQGGVLRAHRWVGRLGELRVRLCSACLASVPLPAAPGVRKRMQFFSRTLKCGLRPSAPGNIQPDARKELWQGGIKRAFFCTPQTFWNDVRKGE